MTLYFAALSCGFPDCRNNTIVITTGTHVGDNATLLCKENAYYPSDKTWERTITCDVYEIGNTRVANWSVMTDECEGNCAHIKESKLHIT